jgi:hypothetical protein
MDGAKTVSAFETDTCKQKRNGDPNLMLCYNCQTSMSLEKGMLTCYECGWRVEATSYPEEYERLRKTIRVRTADELQREM